jgi:AraC-like DNA-binding protein
MVYHNVMRLRPVVDYIAEHYADKIYVETLADMITVSPDYFTKMFRDSMGKTPVDYINAVRMNHAMRLLLTTDMPVNEISDGIGFSGTNYFHRIFKQYMDISPLAYRKSAIK